MKLGAPPDFHTRSKLMPVQIAARVAFIAANVLWGFEAMLYSWAFPHLGWVPPIGIESILAVLALLLLCSSSVRPLQLLGQLKRPIVILAAIPLVITAARLFLQLSAETVPPLNWSHRYVFSVLATGICIFLVAEDTCGKPRWLRRLLIAIFVMAIISSLMGVLEIAVNRSYPWSEWYAAATKPRLLRLAGPHTTISSFVTSVLPISCIAFALWMHGSRRLKLPAWLTLPAALLPVMAMVLGSSRSGILAFAVSGVLVLAARRPGRRMMVRAAPFVLPACVILIVLLVSRQAVLKRGLDDPRITKTWSVYLPIIACHPEGYPWAKRSAAQAAETIRCHEKILGEPPSDQELRCQQRLSPHNFFMVVFLQFGWLGGLACAAVYGLLLCRGGRTIVQNYQNRIEQSPWLPLVIGLTAANCAVLVNMFFHDQNTFLGKSSLWLYLGLLSGAVWQSQRVSPRTEEAGREGDTIGKES